MMRKLASTLLLLVLSQLAWAQFFQFNQRYFTPQRANPAKVASEDSFHALLNFREQSTGGDFSLRSTALDLAYPFHLNSRTVAGLGLFVLDDRTAGRDVFSMQEIGLSSGVSLPSSRYSFFTLGLSYSFATQGLNDENLSTGSQFVPDRGFDLSLDNGEVFDDVRVSFQRLNTSILWKKLGRNNQLQASYGLSLFDLNRPKNALTETEQFIKRSFLAEGIQMVSQKGNDSWYVEGLAYGQLDQLTAQAGFIWDRRIRRDQHLIVKARYSTEHYAIISARIEKDRLVVGATYDLALGKRAVSNQSAFEVGIGWKGVSNIKRKRSKKKNRRRRGPVKPPIGNQIDTTENKVEQKELIELDSSSIEQQIEESPEETESKKTSSLQIGPISQKKNIVEQIDARFPFKTNSYQLSSDYRDFLDEIVARLLNNSNQVIEIIGHSDSIGSIEDNLVLSKNRAQAVANYLIENGIKKSRISVDGKGELNPISTNDTAEGRALNRRVEMRIKE